MGKFKIVTPDEDIICLHCRLPHRDHCGAICNECMYKHTKTRGVCIDYKVRDRLTKNVMKRVSYEPNHDQEEDEKPIIKEKKKKVKINKSPIRELEESFS